ncbi:MAG: DUF5118 domain-containing protein, partial [Bacteroidales bacterium]|nr:DUF5118 domain-containing protein [Bacteroidales bacterium]
MKRRFYVIVALLLALGVTAGAQGRGPGRPGAEPPKDSNESAEKEKTPELTFKEGLFGVAQNEKDWYFEIPDEILGRRILAVTRFVSNTPGVSEYGGEEVN